MTHQSHALCYPRPFFVVLFFQTHFNLLVLHAALPPVCFRALVNVFFGPSSAKPSQSYGIHNSVYLTNRFPSSFLPIHSLSDYRSYIPPQHRNSLYGVSTHTFHVTNCQLLTHFICPPPPHDILASYVLSSPVCLTALRAPTSLPSSSYRIIIVFVFSRISIHFYSFRPPYNHCWAFISSSRDIGVTVTRVEMSVVVRRGLFSYDGNSFNAQLENGGDAHPRMESDALLTLITSRRPVSRLPT